MPVRTLLLGLVLLSPAGTLCAQEVEEPPIPVMIVCPYHEDSLRRAYESEIMVGAQRKEVRDSISLSAIRAAEGMSERMERWFTFLYLLLALLALTSIAALRMAYRLRLELQSLRTSYPPPTLSLPAPVVVKSSPLRSRPKNRVTPKQTRKTTSSGRAVRRSRRPRA